MQIQQGGVTEPSPEDVEVWVSDSHRVEFHAVWPSPLVKLKDPVVYREVISKHVCTAAIDHLTASSTFQLTERCCGHFSMCCARQRNSLCNGTAYTQCVGASLVAKEWCGGGARRVCTGTRSKQQFCRGWLWEFVCSSYIMVWYRVWLFMLCCLKPFWAPQSYRGPTVVQVAPRVTVTWLAHITDLRPQVVSFVV